MPLVSISEYARLKGCSHVSIVNKIKNGILSKKAVVKVPGYKHVRINIEQADKDLEKRGDIGGTIARELHSAPIVEKPVDDDEPDNFNAYRETKIDHEKLKAKKLMLEIAEKENRLLDVDEVRARVIKLVSETKDSILNIPPRIAPLLVSITDPVLMENKLMQELNEALGNLSRLNTLGGK